jgi:hypothetical protein
MQSEEEKKWLINTQIHITVSLIQILRFTHSVGN